MLTVVLFGTECLHRPHHVSAILALLTASNEQVAQLLNSRSFLKLNLRFKPPTIQELSFGHLPECANCATKTGGLTASTS